jgi:acyl carrier protein
MIEKAELQYISLDLSRYGDAVAVTDARYKTVLAEVQAVFCRVLSLPKEEVDVRSNFLLDLGGSSLEYFALLEELSKIFNTGFSLEESFLSTPAEFAKYILNH